MAVVTDLKYYLENPLLNKIDLIIKRIEQPHPKKDALLIVEGAEGEGKTNTACAIAYYVKHQTNRDVALFFSLEKLIKYAQETENKIIIWDEPALDALSTDWYKKSNKNLIRLLMMCRKKRHFFIFNFTKFHKFSEYIVVDRGIGLIHMYSRKELYPGRFVYIKKNSLERLYLSYRTSKKRLYNKFYTFRGSFPEVLEKHFSKMDFSVEGKEHATIEDYERVKNQAILAIGKDEINGVNKDELKLKELKYRIGSLKTPIKSKRELGRKLGYSFQMLYNWRNNYKTELINEGVVIPPSNDKQ